MSAEAFRAFTAEVIFSRFFSGSATQCVTLDDDALGGLTSTVSTAPVTGSGGVRAPAVHPRGAYRRALVARCRVLRTEIKAFEDDFFRTHGRRPHSAGDRHLHAMQPAYAEYRSLKTTVRDNAALHVQAVWRGSRIRRRLGGSGEGEGSRRAAAIPHVTSRRSGSPAAAPRPTLSALTDAPAPTPLPATSVVAAAHAATNSGASGGEPAAMAKLEQLRREKSALKQKLRAHDAEFAADNGRPPSKAEKEALRPQYMRYHELKALIATLEVALGVVPAVSATQTPAAAANTPTIAAQAPAVLAPAPASRMRPNSNSFDSLPDSGSMSAAPSPSASGEQLLLGAGLGLEVAEDEVSHARGGGGATAAAVGTSSATAAVAAVNASASSAVVRSLRAEKKRLQAQLRAFEADFEGREHRRVKFVRDIQPVLADYTRYKDVKALLKELGPDTV